MVEHHDVWYMIDDAHHVEGTVHKVGAALSFILPHIQSCLAYEKGVDVSPMREALEALREWEAEDESLLEAHVATLMEMEKKAAAAKKPAAAKRGSSSKAAPAAKRGRKK